MRYTPALRWYEAPTTKLRAREGRERDWDGAAVRLNEAVVARNTATHDCLCLTIFRFEWRVLISSENKNSIYILFFCLVPWKFIKRSVCVLWIRRSFNSTWIFPKTMAIFKWSFLAHPLELTECSNVHKLIASGAVNGAEWCDQSRYNGYAEAIT